MPPLDRKKKKKKKKKKNCHSKGIHPFHRNKVNGQSKGNPLLDRKNMVIT